MLLLYYIMSPISKSSIFFFVSYDCVICDSDKYYNSVMCDIILQSLSISKSENEN